MPDVLAHTNLTEEVIAWVHREAELLDDGLERQWLDEMVSDEIVYQVPVRQRVERARGAGWVEGSYHFDERRGSLESRVARNETAYAWAEDPPSRIRHFVTNIRVHTDDERSIKVRSNLLIFRTHHDTPTPELISGDRHDVLTREGDHLKLIERRVYLDTTVINMHNFAIFF